MYKTIKCKQCKKDTDDFDYRWNGGVCDRCKVSRTIRFVLILGLIGLIISLFFSNIEYNYELNKCLTLESTESNYDFTNTIEINAEYNSDCYYLNHHPLARLNYYVLGGVIGGAIFGLIGMVLGLLTRV